jgi:GNAT superfamily N-acetyltransferase
MPEGLARSSVAGGSLWLCRVPGSAQRAQRLVLVDSVRYPDGTLVELAEPMARVQIGEDALCTATYGEAGAVVELQVSDRAAPKAPPIWFAEIRESTARPPAVNLLAFTGHDQPTGVLREHTDLTSLAVSSADQLGALRWYPASGEVDQIYVQPAWRRRSVASALIMAAATLSRARGWSSLWGDGQRTEQGEALRNTQRWRHRTADLTHLAPPMTPGE